MKLRFNAEYKSLNSFESEELRDFTVITGKNGSGKSQLIELLKGKAFEEGGDAVEIEPDIQRIQFEGIENQYSSTPDREVWISHIKQIYDTFKNLNEKELLLIKALNYKNFKATDLAKAKEFKEIEDYIGEDLGKLIEAILDSYHFASPSYKYTEQYRKQFIGYFIRNTQFGNKIISVLAADSLAEHKDKDVHQLTLADFFSSPPNERLLSNSSLFGTQLHTIFYQYARRRDQNRRLYFDKINDEAINNSTSDIEFIEQNTPPWEIINNILESHRLNFKFQGIDKKDFSPDIPVSFPFIKTTTNKEIDFQNLSSGEKIIIGIIITLFTNSYYSENLEFPELVVFDEPDAHLHPEMSKLLIDVLEGTFVKKLGIKVIMTTHSPSTVALCPDDSVYELRNEPETSLKRISKDEALKLLTGFIPTLSIDYENHKQVYVESPTDVVYYQTIFDKLYQHKSYPFKLYFISLPYGKGNCSQVKDLVSQLRQARNKTSFGIIDWDLENDLTSYVKVHGYMTRYNIERFLFDPIYLAVLLMNLGTDKNIHQMIDIDPNINEYLLGQEDEVVLQTVADKMIEKIFSVNRVPYSELESRREITYYNGRKISLPIWFLVYKGHSFEDKIKKAFPALESKKFTDTGALQKELTKIVAKCYPFIPNETVTVIEEIISSNSD